MSLSGTALLGPGTTCTMSGTFTQEGGNVANMNVFDTSITFGAGCPFSNFTGIGLESKSDYFSQNGSAPGTYLYAASSSSAMVLEIFK
jgi:hypothetical protein